MTRKFGSALGGLSEDEFIILSHLARAQDSRMRRVELAEAAGLTATWLTRLFLSMEQTGLVSREESRRDARMSYIILTQGGEQKLERAIERAEKLISGLVPAESTWQTEGLLIFLKRLEKSL